MGVRRYEISSSGIDESLQGISSDPYGSIPTSFALRVPPALNITGVPQPRYEFCLATRIVQGKTRVRGIRQLLTIGVSTSIGGVLDYPVRCNVQTPWWRFVDGNVSWHLVKEPATIDSTKLVATDSANWTYGPTGKGPAMLYQSFTNGSVNPNGAPTIYFENLTAYVPPLLSAQRRQPIAGCGNLRSILFPWDNPTAWNSIEEEVVGNWRISLYASVLQSNPVIRASAVLPTITVSGYDLGPVVPEETFLAAYAGGEGESPTGAPIYWDIGGAILFEDEEQS